MFKHGLEVKNFAIALSLLLLLCHSLPAQNKKGDPKGSKPNEEQLTFKVPVDVIVVNVTATDNQGKPVRDLTVDDFKVYEDGKPQPIHTFTLESYKAVQSIDSARKEPGVAATESKESNFTRPRLFSLVIDDVTSSRDYIHPTAEAMRRFVEEDLRPGDQAGLFAGSGRIQNEFTSDKQLLLAQIDSLYLKLDSSRVSKSTCPTLSDLQAQRIANNVSDGISMQLATRETVSCLGLQDPDQDPNSLVLAEKQARMAAHAQYQETQYRNRTLLRSLRQYIRSLRLFEAEKNVILFSDGFLFEDLIYELQDVVDQALRAGVVLSTVDIRGLYVPMFQASDNFTLGNANLLQMKDKLLSDDASEQDYPLSQLANDTGGIFYHNSNDLHAGLKEIGDRRAHYYVLTYAAPFLKSDGRYHKIQLQVSRPGVQISYRKGYYAPKEQLSFERRKKEDILDALRAPGDVNEIPIGISLNSYQLEDSRFEVELVTHVDIRRLQFAEEESRRKNLVSLVVVALDENGRYIDGSVKDVSFNLTPSSYSELLSRGFSSKVIFRIPPGRYKITTVVRESVQSKMGSLTKTVEIP